MLKNIKQERNTENMKTIKKERNKEIEKDELVYDDISRKIFEPHAKKDKTNERVEKLRNNERYIEMSLKINPNLFYSSTCFVDKGWLYENLRKEGVNDVDDYIECADNDTKMQWLHLTLKLKKAACIYDEHISMFINYD